MSTGTEVRDVFLAIAAFGIFLALVLWSLIWLGYKGAYTGLAMIGFAILLFGSAITARKLTKDRSDFSFTFVNACLLALIVTAAWLSLGAQLPTTWLFFAITLIVAVQAVAGLFASYRQHFVQQTLKHWAAAKHPYYEGMFRDKAKEHSLVYLALPVGCFSGAITSAVQDLDASQTVRLCAFLTMGLLALGIFAVMIHEALAMTKPHMVQTLMNAPALAQMLDNVCVASELRQVLLINQYALLATFVACAMGFSAIAALDVGWSQWLLLVLVLAAGLVQLPYFVGQVRAHGVVVVTVPAGAERAELRERLQKLAPPVPFVQSSVGMFASGGAGGVLGTLVQKTVEGAITGKP